MSLSIHIFHSPIENESRLFKESKSLIALQIVKEVVILGIGKDGLARVQEYDRGISIIRSRHINAKRYFGLLRKLIAIINLLLYFNLVLKYTLVHKVNYISVHNLLLLPIGSLCKALKRNVKLIYEPHELETERTGLKGVLKKLSIIVERMFIKYPDRVLTVCPPITLWYENHYKLDNVYTIRNVPNNNFLDKQFIKSNKFRLEFNISANDIIYIYQGVLDPFRGVNDLVDIFGSSGYEDKHLVLMGYGDSVDYILSKGYPNVHYKPAVPVNEIIEYTSSADVGIFFVNKPLSLSYKLCLPNKFFEYAISGLPILVSDNLTYLSELIKENGIGWQVQTNFEALKKQVSMISKDQLESFEANLDIYRSSVGWELEGKVLKQLYQF